MSCQALFPISTSSSVSLTLFLPFPHIPPSCLPFLLYCFSLLQFFSSSLLSCSLSLHPPNGKSFAFYQTIQCASKPFSDNPADYDAQSNHIHHSPLSFLLPFPALTESWNLSSHLTVPLPQLLPSTYLLNLQAQTGFPLSLASK